MSVAAPLQWPEGWPRHKGLRDSSGRFRTSAGDVTLSSAVDGLFDELIRLGAKNITISMNINPGRALSRQARRQDDPGVSVFFERMGRPVVMAQDQYDTAAGNARSLALAVSAMRAIERHGGGVIAERAFEGFTGPPAVRGGEPLSVKGWANVLGVSPSAPLSAIRGAWRAQTAEAHKDGNEELMKKLNAAWDEAKRERVGAR